MRDEPAGSYDPATAVGEGMDIAQFPNSYKLTQNLDSLLFFIHYNSDVYFIFSQ